MKHLLLSALALTSAMMVSTNLQAWDEPVRPTRPLAPAFTGPTTEPVADGTYYILNVGSGQFLGAGNDWGTRAVTTTQGIADINATPISLSANVSHVLPFTLEAAETPETALWTADFFFLRHQATDKGADEANWLVHEGNAAWTDGWTQKESANRSDRIYVDNNAFWEIRETNGAYLLVPMDADIVPEEGEPYSPVLGVHSTNMTTYTSYTWTDARVGADYYVDWKFIDASEIEAVKSYIENEYAQFVAGDLAAYEDALAAFNAKTELLSALQEAEEGGIDVTAAGAIYNNPNASLAEVNKAIADLRAALIGSNYDFTGASDDEPLDVTDQVLTNPTFEGNIDGWTITVTGDNLQYQARTDGQTDPSKNWVAITNFIEAWTPSPKTLGDGTISQTVYGLPAGKYMLECDAMATKQGAEDPEAAVEGAYIFIAGLNGETREPIKSPDYQPKHWKVVFVSDGSPALTFGLKVESTTANWISADNFKLWYYGETNRTREQLALDQAIKDAEAIDLDEVRAALTVKEAFTSALAAAKGTQESTDAEALTAATDALNQATANLRTSIADYQGVGKFLLDLDEMMDAADKNQWDVLSNDLYDWQDEINEAYTAGTLTSEDIAGFNDVLREKILAFLNTPNAIKAGNDLTFLLANPHFTQGGGRGISSVPGWTVNNGSMTELRAATHNIETYHAAFDISQTLPNMPAGIYDITLQGFARHDDASVTDKTWLYGGITKAELIDLNNDVSQKRLEPIFTAEGHESGERPQMGDGNYDNTTATDDDGNPLYQANGMTGAYYWFQEINENTNEPYYTNHVNVIMAQEGDLTIGIHCEAALDWVIFDNFQVKYMGVSTAVYAEAINKMIAELNALVEVSDLTVAAKNLYETLPAKAQTAIDNDNTDACIAVLQELDAAITYIKEGNKKFTTLQDMASNYESRMLETPHTDTTGYGDLVSKAANAKDYADEFADNDAIDAMLRQIKAGWAPYVLGDAGEVSEENPYDATDVIYNADYMAGGVNSTDGWTTSTAAGLVGDCIEYFNTNFNISQELLGLKAGYYLLEMDGYYRAGGYEAAAKAYNDSIDARNAKMYVVTANGDSLFTEFHSIFDGAQVEQLLGQDEVQVSLLNKESGETAQLYIPNMPAPAVAYMTAQDEEGNDAALYRNKLLFQVADGADVTIGARKDIQIDQNWTIFGFWKLTYYGETIPSEFVGVKGIDAKTQGKAAAIFGIDGRQQSQLRQGINIVRMSDGSVRKVLVK